MSVLLFSFLSAPRGPSGVAAPALDLQALIRDARAEGNLVVYHPSSRINVAGGIFEKMYGIKVRGTKMGDPEQAERVIREVDSGRVQVDVIHHEDGPFLEARLIPRGYVVSWIPPDMATVIPERYHSPLVDKVQPRIFTYNFETYGSACPISNVWELADPKWKGKVILRDPVLTPANLAFFATVVSSPKMLDKAYRDLYGKPLELTEAPVGRIKNAGWEFLKRLFTNDIVVMGSDEDIGDAVGAAGQKAAPIGMVTLTKLRDNKAKNLKLGTCKTLQPFMGYALPEYVVIVKNAPHPNAAKLWVHFSLTTEGISTWTIADVGGFSANPRVPTHPDNEGTWTAWEKRLLPIDNKRSMGLRQDVLDFWLKYGAK
ncbi:MAG TPA: ABC transporter substrate-binding protein [Anaerolineales bacterium]